MSNGVSEKFDELVTSVASRYCTPADYNDRNRMFKDFDNAFFTEAATRDFVALLDRFSAPVLRSLLIMEGTRDTITDAHLRTLKVVDALTVGWKNYIALHGHMPTDAQMYAAAVMTYDVQTVNMNGVN